MQFQKSLLSIHHDRLWARYRHTRIRHFILQVCCQQVQLSFGVHGKYNSGWDAWKQCWTLHTIFFSLNTCISYLPHFCDKNTWQKQLNKQWVYSSDGWRGCSTSWWRKPGDWSMRQLVTLCPEPGSRDMSDTHLTSSFPFCSYWRPSPRNGATASPQTLRECLLGECKVSQAEIKRDRHNVHTFGKV